MPPTPVNFDLLWQTVTAQYRGNPMGIHAAGHWRQVEKNGVMLAERLGLDADAIAVVRLFGALHDSQRVDDGRDAGHGDRAAAYARAVHGSLFTLDPTPLRKLLDALAGHEYGGTSQDPLIGACWDADRLDLVRLGMQPLERYMSTPEGKRLAREGWR